MTKRSLVSIVVKLVGLWFLVGALVSIPYILMYFGPDFVPRNLGRITVAVTALQIALQWIVSIALIGLSDRIATWLVREDAIFEPSALLSGGGELLGVGVRVTGLWLLAQGIPGLAGILGDRIQVAMGYYPHEFSFAQWSEIVMALVQTALGAYLLLGARHILRLITGTGRSSTTTAVGGGSADV